MTTILALDLGTTTGWALFQPPGSTISGTWGLKPGRFDGGGMRFVKFQARLDEIHATAKVRRCYFEEVRRHLGTDAAHVYGGLMAILTAWCEKNGVPYEGVPVGSIKKSFTGNGNAPKQLMVAEARRRGFEVIDDNEADALALLDFVLRRDLDAAIKSEAAA
jgi:crossover junction endodeoxyribonuclease RuvC